MARLISACYFPRWCYIRYMNTTTNITAGRAIELFNTLERLAQTAEDFATRWRLAALYDLAGDRLRIVAGSHPTPRGYLDRARHCETAAARLRR